MEKKNNNNNDCEINKDVINQSKNESQIGMFQTFRNWRSNDDDSSNLKTAKTQINKPRGLFKSLLNLDLDNSDHVEFKSCNEFTIGSHLDDEIPRKKNRQPVWKSLKNLLTESEKNYHHITEFTIGQNILDENVSTNRRSP